MSNLLAFLITSILIGFTGYFSYKSGNHDKVRWKFWIKKEDNDGS